MFPAMDKNDPAVSVFEGIILEILAVAVFGFGLVLLVNL
jgi:hypothetical protein